MKAVVAPKKVTAQEPDEDDPIVDKPDLAKGSVHPNTATSLQDKTDPNLWGLHRRLDGLRARLLGWTALHDQDPSNDPIKDPTAIMPSLGFGFSRTLWASWVT